MQFAHSRLERTVFEELIYRVVLMRFFAANYERSVRARVHHREQDRIEFPFEKNCSRCFYRTCSLEQLEVQQELGVKSFFPPTFFSIKHKNMREKLISLVLN